MHPAWCHHPRAGYILNHFIMYDIWICVSHFIFQCSELTSSIVSMNECSNISHIAGDGVNIPGSRHFHTWPHHKCDSCKKRLWWHGCVLLSWKQHLWCHCWVRNLCSFVHYAEKIYHFWVGVFFSFVIYKKLYNIFKNNLNIQYKRVSKPWPRWYNSSSPRKFTFLDVEATDYIHVYR